MELGPTEPLVLVFADIEGPSGNATVKMALDTASTYVIIPPEAARNVGYAPEAAESTAQLHTATSLETAPVVTLLGVRAMGIRVGLVEAGCRDMPEQGPVQGLLGLSFLRHLDLDLHFRSRRLAARGPGSRTTRDHA